MDISLMVILFTSLSRAICIRPAWLSRANYRFSFVDCVGCVDFPRRGFTFTGVDRFVWYGLAWSWLMVPRAEMLLDTLARIIRLIRNNRRHSRYTIRSKKRRGDESTLDIKSIFWI